MKRSSLTSVLFSLAACWSFAAERPAAQTHQVKLNGHTFTLPLGFEIELVAGPPLVIRPIEADFDEEGRLYVSDSSGSNEKVEMQLQKKPHRIVRLEATHGDGRFDRSVVFADKMMFPEGVMWHAGSLYVAAPPSIWKLTDTNGDGVADQRVEWFKGKTLTGCANDLHGPYLGPDGWIYWCKGAFARQTYDRPGKLPFSTRAAHIFRCRPDGTGIEPVMTGGMDNPVEVIFTPGGERIFTTTFLVHPGGGNRDGLIHAIYGGIYGKDWDPIYEHKWTGPSVMPLLTHMGAAAPCGLIRYESQVFGKEYQDNLFACQFNKHKISRHILQPEGATFKARDEDFLVSDNLDFHPTDVLEDADGSLLVIDTGGWYKLCCPTSQLHKPDVLGAIYRVRRKETVKIEDARGLNIAWSKNSTSEIARLLADDRPLVRRRAIHELAKRKDVDAAIALFGNFHARPPIGSPPPGTYRFSTEARRNAVWSLTRMSGPSARAAVRSRLVDRADSIRQVAIHSVSLWRDHKALPDLLDILSGKSLHNRRAAAEALGRIGDKKAVARLLQAAGEENDRVLEHSITYALIEIADPAGTAAGLHSTNPSVRRTALIALDRMDGGKLDSQAVSAELTSSDPKLKEAAWWIAGRHPEWGSFLAGFLRDRLKAPELSVEDFQELVQQLARFAGAKPVQDLLAEYAQRKDRVLGARMIALRAMAQARLKATPAAWISSVTQVLDTDDGKLLEDAIAAARTMTVPKPQVASFASALQGTADNPRLPDGMRLNALAAVPGGLVKVASAQFDFLRGHLAPDQAVATRGAAGDVLAHARLNAGQLVALCDSLKNIGTMEIERVLDAFAQSSDEKVGIALIGALNTSSARSGLRVETLKPRLAKFGPGVQKQAEALYAALDADASKQRARLEQLLSSLHAGDIRRGQAVFNGTKAACSSCHAIGYLGGKLGPDLTRIGGIRNERDLLESIVFPSASFVRSYEPVLITTKSGKLYNGLIRSESVDEIVLAINATEEARIARKDIEDLQPSKVSVMPAGLDQQLTVQDLADLVAFLKACK